MPKHIPKSKFPGLKKAAKDFVPFKVVSYKRDPEYGYEHVYLLFIKFKEDKDYGLCIYDTRKQDFIEEPGELEWFDLTLEQVKQKYGFEVK